MMPEDSSPSNPDIPSLKNRRRFLMYMAGGAIASIGIGYLFRQASESREANQQNPCTSDDPGCKSAQAGVVAQDQNGQTIQVNTLLAKNSPGTPIPVKGLPNGALAYLVITQGPKIAEYAIRPVCPHLGCAVNWNAKQKRFICPCHGAQFDPQGRVVKGPASRPLPLVTVSVKQNQVRLSDRQPAKDPR